MKETKDLIEEKKAGSLDGSVDPGSHQFSLEQEEWKTVGHEIDDASKD